MRYTNLSQAIDFIKSIPVDQVINHYIPGIKGHIKCPFPSHNEKSASFSVKAEIGIFSCFGCHQRGSNGLDFLMLYKEILFIDALEELCEIFGFELKTRPLNPQEEAEYQLKESLSIIIDQAVKLSQEYLAESTEALEYLKSRDIDQAMILKYKIGYGGPGFKKKLMARGYSESQLIAAGVISQKGGDYFFGRLIIPIKSKNGKYAALSGRQLKENTEYSKYLNGADTLLYNKSETLFNLNYAAAHMKSLNKVYIVEGYFDVIRHVMHEKLNTVATCGTALTEEQANLLRKYTQRATIIFDGDKSGKKAVERAIPILLKAGLLVDVAILSNNEDPDSFLQKYGKDAYKEELKINSCSFVSFLINSKEYHQVNPIEQSTIITEILELIPFISEFNAALVITLIRELASLTGIASEILTYDYSKLKNQ